MTGGIVAVGFFDGVHLGHRDILRGADTAITFSNHPMSVLAPGNAPSMIATAGKKESLIRECGVSNVDMREFTPAYAALRAEEFMETLRGADEVRCGADWRFGAGACGDASLLGNNGFKVKVFPPVLYRGERISSTRIRQSIAEGDMESAAAMLGRAWTAEGTVVKGKGLGRQVGRPTVNVSPDPAIVVPATGVYAVKCCGAKAVANWGMAPTMGDKSWNTPVLEIHFPGGLPAEFPAGSAVEVEFVRFLRPERKFSSFDALAAQIAEDCKCLA